MNGRAGAEAEKIREFGVLLGKEAGVTPVFWDERLTTVQAERSLLQMDLSRRRRRQVIDQVAAAILLESFLRSHNPPER
jgi:putative Holliday junction resolvase